MPSQTDTRKQDPGSCESWCGRLFVCVKESHADPLFLQLNPKTPETCDKWAFAINVFLYVGAHVFLYLVLSSGKVHRGFLRKPAFDSLSHELELSIHPLFFLVEVSFFLVSTALLYRAKMDDPGYLDFGNENMEEAIAVSPPFGDTSLSSLLFFIFSSLYSFFLFSFKNNSVESSRLCGTCKVVTTAILLFLACFDVRSFSLTSLSLSLCPPDCATIEIKTLPILQPVRLQVRSPLFLGRKLYWAEKSGCLLPLSAHRGDRHGPLPGIFAEERVLGLTIPRHWDGGVGGGHNLVAARRETLCPHSCLPRLWIPRLLRSLPDVHHCHEPDDKREYQLWFAALFLLLLNHVYLPFSPASPLSSRSLFLPPRLTEKGSSSPSQHTARSCREALPQL